MDLSAAVIMPVAVGAIMWIMDMLLPKGKISRTAGAVAGIIVLHALTAPLFAFMRLAPDGDFYADMSIEHVLTDEGGTAP